MLERRRNSRIDLHVPLFLLPAGATEPICTETENIGVDSFFCNAPAFFPPDECLKFMFFLYRTTAEGRRVVGIRVQGEAEVIRVSVRPAPAKYGIACRLRSYRVLHASGLLAPEEIVATMAQAL